MDHKGLRILLVVHGVITAAAYRAGQFLSADLDKASEVNERNSLAISSTHGEQLIVTQIAGLIARRIVCDLGVGAPPPGDAHLGARDLALDGLLEGRPVAPAIRRLAAPRTLEATAVAHTLTP